MTVLYLANGNHRDTRAAIMDGSSSNAEKSWRNQINQEQILVQTIKKELKYQKLYTQYTQNPFSDGLYMQYVMIPHSFCFHRKAQC